jgi:hypothetical protein
MNSPALYLARLGFAALIVSLTGCETTSINSRIAEKSAVFGTLNEATQKNLREGTIEQGYTADMVYIALGSPSKVKVRDTAQGKVGIWEYANFFPADYTEATAPDGTKTSEPEQVTATSSFTTPGHNDYGHVKKSPDKAPSYLALDRRGTNPGTPKEGSFSGRSAAMDLLDIPDMDSASLYVIFFEGRVAQIKMRRNN